jgi:hypothetical protein
LPFTCSLWRPTRYAKPLAPIKPWPVWGTTRSRPGVRWACSMACRWTTTPPSAAGTKHRASSDDSGACVCMVALSRSSFRPMGPSAMGWSNGSTGCGVRASGSDATSIRWLRSSAPVRNLRNSTRNSTSRHLCMVRRLWDRRETRWWEEMPRRAPADTDRTAVGRSLPSDHSRNFRCRLNLRPDFLS